MSGIYLPEPKADEMDLAKWDDLDRCAICGWRLGDEDDHRAVADPRGEIQCPICEHCAACRQQNWRAA